MEPDLDQSSEKERQADRLPGRLVNVESGRELRTLNGHSAPVLRVALSKDGGVAVSASMDKTLKVWNVESGREEHSLEGHSDRVCWVALSTDGKAIIVSSVSWDTTLKVWDLETGLPLATFTFDVLASCCAFIEWDLESGRTVRTLEGHSGMVTGVALTSDGRLAVSASADRTLKVWDLESGRELRTLEGHSDAEGLPGAVTGVALSGTGGWRSPRRRTRR